MPDGNGGSSGGSSSGGDTENAENQRKLDEAIESGRLKTKLDKRKQAKHRFGSEEYNKEIAAGRLPSYTKLSNMEVQKIINNHRKDGIVYFCNEQYRKVITEKENIGMFGDRITGKYIPTNRATIHYSIDGTHLVPAPPKGE